jgi:choline dehydrogenase-like flavoprotein
MELRPETIVVQLIEQKGRITAVRAVNARSGERFWFKADRVILAAGALATPHLLLTSGLHTRNPAGDMIGRFLMRHCNAMMYGFLPVQPNPRDEHYKQLAIHDFYFGDPRHPEFQKLGNIQQVMAPPVSLVRAMLPRAISGVVARFVSNLTGLLVIAEDQPRAENRVRLAAGKPDRFGLPPASIRHRHTRRDRAARRALLSRAREVLRAAGARFTLIWPVNTFSHAVGTVRMGSNPQTAPLDSDCRLRGVDNLWVTDGSVFPSSGGVNPSLTIAANALRVGALIAGLG